MSRSKTKGQSLSYGRSWKRYYRVAVGVDAVELRALAPEKLQFLVSCPALISIDFDPSVYEADGEKWTAEIKFKDLEKGKCAAVVAAVDLKPQSVRGRMW